MERLIDSSLLWLRSPAPSTAVTAVGCTVSSVLYLGLHQKDTWMLQLFHYISRGGWFIGCSKTVWLYICFQWDSNADSWGVMSSRCLVLPWVSMPQHQTRRVHFSASFFHDKTRLKETTGYIQGDDKKRRASCSSLHSLTVWHFYCLCG